MMTAGDQNDETFGSVVIWIVRFFDQLKDLFFNEKGKEFKILNFCTVFTN